MSSPASRAAVYRVAADADQHHVDDAVDVDDAVSNASSPRASSITAVADVGPTRPRKLQQEVAASRSSMSSSRRRQGGGGRHGDASIVVAAGMSDLVAIAATRRTVAASMRLLPRRELEARSTAAHAFCSLMYRSQHDVLFREPAHALARRALVDNALRHRRAAFDVAILVAAESVARFQAQERPALRALGLLHADAHAHLQEVATAHRIIAYAIRVWRARLARRRKHASIHVCRSYRLATSVLRDALPRLWAARQHRQRMQPQQALRRECFDGRRTIQQEQADEAVAAFATVAVEQCADLASSLKQAHQGTLLAAFAAFAESCCADTIWRDEARARRSIVSDALAHEHEHVAGARLLVEAGFAALEDVAVPHARAATELEQAEQLSSGFGPSAGGFVAACQIQRWVRGLWAERRNRALAHTSGVAEAISRRVAASSALLAARVDVAVATFAASAISAHVGIVQPLVFANFVETRLALMASAMCAGYEGAAIAGLAAHREVVATGLGTATATAGDDGGPVDGGLHRAAALGIQRVCRAGRTRWRIEKTAAILARERDWREVIMPLETPLESARRIAGLGKAASARKAVARVRTHVHAERRSRAELGHEALADAERLHRQHLNDVAFDHCLRLRRRAAERAGALLGAAIAETAASEAAERASNVAAWQRWFDVTALQAASLVHVGTLEGQLLRRKQVLGYRVTFEAIFRAHFGMRRIVAEQDSEWMKIRLLERGELRVVRLFELSRAALQHAVVVVPPPPPPVKTPPLSRPGSASKGNRNVRPPSAGRRSAGASAGSSSGAAAPEATAAAARDVERSAAIRRETQALFSRRLAAMEKREGDERYRRVEAAELVERGACALERAHGVAAWGLLAARTSDYDFTKLQLEWQMLADAADEEEEEEEASPETPREAPTDAAAAPAAESLGVPQTGARRTSKSFEETQLRQMADDAFFSSDDEKEPNENAAAGGAAPANDAASVDARPVAPGIVFNDSSSSSSGAPSPSARKEAEEEGDGGGDAPTRQPNTGLHAGAASVRRASRNFEETELQNMADDAFFSSDDEKEPDEDDDHDDAKPVPTPHDTNADQQQSQHQAGGGLAAPASRNFEETELQNMADDAFFSSDDEKEPNEDGDGTNKGKSKAPASATSSTDGDDSVVYDEADVVWV